MSARRRALLGLLIVVAALAAAAVRQRSIDARRAHSKPPLLLLTSLPLLFAEDFSLDRGGSPALTQLQRHYRVVPISVTDAHELAGGGLLLMAHPFAQTPENLVALDRWVRSGGRVLLLADPLLEWPSERPLGDPLRPAPMFSDTGLLAHWGLRLDSPDIRGPAVRQLGGQRVETVSPGALAGDCAIGRDRLVARCHIGRGRATIVADADLLNVARLGANARKNLDGLVEELAVLERS